MKQDKQINLENDSEATLQTHPCSYINLWIWTHGCRALKLQWGIMFVTRVNFQKWNVLVGICVQDHIGLTFKRHEPALRPTTTTQSYLSVQVPVAHLLQIRVPKAGNCKRQVEVLSFAVVCIHYHLLFGAISLDLETRKIVGIPHWLVAFFCSICWSDAQVWWIESPRGMFSLDQMLRRDWLWA